MHKILNLEELVATKQLEKEKKNERGDLEIEKLYDLIIPPGTLVSVIYDIVEEFGLDHGSYNPCEPADLLRFYWIAFMRHGR